MPSQMPYSAIPAIVSRMAAAIGIAIATLVPLSFGLDAYLDLVVDVRTGARLSADRVAQYASVQGDGWRYGGARIARMLDGLAESIDMPRQFVEHLSGAPIVDIGTPLSGPTVSQRWPIVVQGDTIGFVRVESRLAPVFTRIGLLVLLGAGLGGSTYLLVHLLPLRVLRKVTGELERTEIALVASHEKLSEAIEALPDGFALFDSEDRAVLFNLRFLDASGLLADDVPGSKTFEEILRIGAGRGHYAEALGREKIWVAERTRQHRSFDGAVEQKLADGRIFRVVERSTANGGRVGVWTDITPLKRSEAERAALREQFHHAQKQEAIGKLTGGMAHDFNNYLGIIIGNLHLVDQHVDPAGKKLLTTALRGAEQSAQLIRSLLAFSRQKPLSPRRVDVSLNLNTVATLLRHTLGEDIALTVNIAPDIWPVRIDSSQLDSAIINLANNARDAMPRGGPLTISARNVQIDAPEAKKLQDAAPGNYVLVEMADTGAGMPPAVASQAFEPFFSTKPVGHGTGLGLSMVYGFVKQSGGWIQIQSEVGRGTAVRIGLPQDRDSEGADTGESDPGPVPAARATEVVLVVEDNPMLRQTVVDQLTALGYPTIAAENGAAALAILAERELPVELLFTDVIMAGDMNGYELVRNALKVRPGLKALLTSGRPRDSLDTHHTADVELLAKPYRPADLARAIRAALEAAA